MTIIEAIVLGAVQGLTEFIPVSSSGHLLILHNAFGVQEGGLMFDVALHIGTLAALLAFFFREVKELVRGLVRQTPYSRVSRLVIAATIPAAIIGYLLEDAAESTFRSPVLVSFNLAFFGLIMLAAERYAKRYSHPREMLDISRHQALGMGLAQAAAIVPGVSRSGSTITAGLFLGLNRVAATRFSFLLGIPITAGAVLKVLSADQAMSRIQDEAALFVTGIVVAFLTGVFAIRFMLAYLAKHSLKVFAYYRFALAGVTLLALAIW